MYEGICKSDRKLKTGFIFIRINPRTQKKVSCFFLEGEKIAIPFFCKTNPRARIKYAIIANNIPTIILFDIKASPGINTAFLKL